jgi:hypothetical protein
MSTRSDVLYLWRLFYSALLGNPAESAPEFEAVLRRAVEVAGEHGFDETAEEEAEREFRRIREGIDAGIASRHESRTGGPGS